MSVTVPGTTVHAAREAILAAIQAQPACAQTGLPAGQQPVLVVLDEIGQYDPQDSIVVGPTEIQEFETVQMVGTGGTGWMDETYTVEVTISCLRSNADPSVVSAQAAVLVNAVCAAVRTDPSLGLGQGHQPAGMGFVIEAKPARAHWDSSWAENNAGRIVEVILEIAVHARL